MNHSGFFTFQTKTARKNNASADRSKWQNQHIPSYQSQAGGLLVILDQKLLRNEESQHEGLRKRTNR